MIRIERGDEPDMLEGIRSRHLTRLRDFIKTNRTNPGSKQIHGYQVVRDNLLKVQRSKCCYCEKELEPTHEPVDHYRPKAGATRAPGCVDDYGYWWLAYTWKNLVYACNQCNGTKSTQFPLAIGSAPLDPDIEEEPPGRELPLLIDPMMENGIEHIEFCPEKRGVKIVWIPQPRSNSPKGEWTIKCCGLGRDGLVTRYTKHVEHYVVPEVKNIEAALRFATSEPKILRREFKTVCAKLLNPDQQFVALSYDALVFHTAEKLAPLGYSWPMPK